MAPRFIPPSWRFSFSPGKPYCLANQVATVRRCKAQSEVRASPKKGLTSFPPEETFPATPHTFASGEMPAACLTSGIVSYC